MTIAICFSHLQCVANDDEKLEFEGDLKDCTIAMSNDDEDDGGGLHECASDPVWIIYNRHVLRSSDKRIIGSGELSDKHTV